MSLTTVTSVVIKANTTDVSSSIDWTTIDMTLVLTKEVSTLKFNVQNPGATAANAGSPFTKYTPTVGDQIDLYETDSASVVRHKFGGTITEIETVIKGSILTSQVTCTDWSYKMNGKLVAKSYVLMDPADIVADIVSNYCPAGFNATTYVQRAGYTIPSIKFNYEQPTKCIAALAAQIGWDWNVDASKNVHFFLAENNFAPFPIDDTTGGLEWESIDVDVNLQNMKNSVFVIGGIFDRTLTAGNTPDVFAGDGVTTSFTLFYAYTNGTITVTVGGANQSIGIANQVTNPASYNCVYDKSTQSLVFNVAPAATVVVSGIAEIPIIAQAIDQLGIATYGEFQDVIFDSQIKSTQEAQMRAQAEILLYGHAVYDVKFNTITPGLEVGQNILLNSTKFGISNYPLVIKRLEGVGNKSVTGELKYQVECVGSDNVTFVDIMSGILQQENANNTSTDNTTLEILLRIAELLGITDTMGATGKVNVYAWGTLIAAIVDSYSESNQDSNGIVYSGTPGRGQSFTSGSNPTEVLDSCVFYLKKAGSPTGNAVAQLFAHTGTYGSTSGIPTGPALATSAPLDVSTLTTSYALKTFNFSGANRVTLAANTNYFIVLSYTGGDISNNVLMGEDESSPSASGRAATLNNSGVWSVDTMFNTDVCFYVYGIPQGGLYNLATWG